MPARTTLILAEGPHDIEFCARLLTLRNFFRIRNITQLQELENAFWAPTIPKMYPQGGDLLARHPVPLFLENGSGQSVALVVADGISKLEQRLNNALNILSRTPDSVGVILDADCEESPSQRFETLVKGFKKEGSASARLEWPSKPGVLSRANTKTGVFILPNNQDHGTLEDLLLEAAEVAYPDLLKAAKQYTDLVSEEAAREGGKLDKSDLKEFLKPAGRQKAIVASMTGILKPGKTLAVSIQDNRWLEPDLSGPRILDFQCFLDQLISRETQSGN